MLQLYVCDMCDHLRPLGFLSADDLLVVGHDLEEISFFVDHSVLFISIHKHEAKRGVKRIRHVHVSSYSCTVHGSSASAFDRGHPLGGKYS